MQRRTTRARTALKAKRLLTTLVSLVGCYSLPSAGDYEPAVASDAQLVELLEPIRARHRQPAVAAAVIRGDRVVAAGAVGAVAVGSEQLVTALSRFHAGSTTKPVTALLIAILVREGTLRYDTTLGEVFPELPMRDEYRSVTIHDLLLSRAGVIAFQQTSLEATEVVETLMSRIPATTPHPVEQRDLVTRFALSRPPVAPPGTRSVYSNVAWSILGHVAESVVGTPYERLVADRIFAPLGIEGAQFGGWPASEQDREQPRGHYRERAGLRAQPFDDPYVLPLWMNPAGGLHCTIVDFARLAREMLLGLDGRGVLLPRSAYETIHSIQGRERMNVMYPGTRDRAMATFGYGWGVIEVSGGGVLSVADGTAGTFYARLAILPALDVAYAGFTNSGDGERALTESVRALTGIRVWR